MSKEGESAMKHIAVSQTSTIHGLYGWVCSCLHWLLYWWKISDEQIKTAIIHRRGKKAESQKVRTVYTKIQKAMPGE